MLPVVPLFHANSWGIAFSAPSMGTKLVMPGPKLDGASVYELLDTEKVTYTAGVPTVWLMLLQHMAANNLKLPHLKMVVCGGSAMPRSMIEAFLDMGVGVRHAWTYMEGKIAKWWLPDDVAFVDGIPHTATGKILKTALREQFSSYRFPNAVA
jgi:fatty-acyl-CoA synthase